LENLALLRKPGECCDHAAFLPQAPGAIAGGVAAQALATRLGVPFTLIGIGIPFGFTASLISGLAGVDPARTGVAAALVDATQLPVGNRRTRSGSLFVSPPVDLGSARS